MDSITAVIGDKIMIFEDGEKLALDKFHLLTGKHLRSPERFSITITREGGHCRVYDFKFIEGQNYRKEGRKYLCTKVIRGEGLLEPVDGGLEVVVSKHPLDWEIA